MQERPTGAASLIDDFLRQDLKIVTIVCVLLTNHVNQSRPAAPNANDLIAFTQRTNRDSANGRVQPRDITASRQNTNDTFFCIHNVFSNELQIYNLPEAILQPSTGSWG